MRSEYKSLVRKHQGKRLHMRPRHRGKYNIKIEKRVRWYRAGFK